MGLELAANHMEVVESYSNIPYIGFSDDELVSHVRHALQSVSSTSTEGYSDGYELLLQTVNNTLNLDYFTADEVAFIVTSLISLKGAVSHIDNVRHVALLSAIFEMNMWRLEVAVMEALVELIISLASNGKLLDLCLDMLVRHFIPPQKFSPHKKIPDVLNQVHSALKNISKSVPLAPMRLLPIILHRMPGKFANEASLTMYMDNMLRLESSSIGEPLRETILRALVDRLIELDVEIGWDAILRDDSSKGIFDMELEDVEETADYAEKDGDKAVAEKIDSLMVLTCEHLKSCSGSGRLIKVFEILLESFKITVLEAYRSKFTQFVIFYACSLDPENCGKDFANSLVDIFEHDKNPPLRRVSAVAYLASYLSRAKFLESSFIIDKFNRLVNWCYEYCQNRNVQGRTVNPKAHKVFYSACQAIMYVLCFRMRAILPRLKPQLLERIFQDPLDPLKVCLPSVVQEFLWQTKAVGLFGDFGDFHLNCLLESDNSKAYGGTERLDMFFPFDPCLLRNCERFIHPNFIYWSMVRTADADEDDMTSEDDVNHHVVDDIDGNFSDDDDVMGRSYNDQDLDLDEFENSLNKMSITPKSTSKYNMAAAGGFQMPMRMPARIRPSPSPESL